MQSTVDLLYQLGQFALLVIAVCVVIMLVISIVDSHPRDRDSKDDRNRR